jgi:GAF domain-containing protein
MPTSPRSLFHAALTQLAQTDKPDLAAALRQILSVDATTMSVARVSYWELAPDHSKITCSVLYEHPAARFSSGGELRAVDFPGYFRALLQSKAIVADDAWTDPRTCEFADVYFRPHDIRSMLDVPVWRRGKLAGVVCHEHVGGDRAWTDDEQAFAVGIGNLVSIALEARKATRSSRAPRTTCCGTGTRSTT